MDININIGEDEINAGGLNIPLIKGEKGDTGEAGHTPIRGTDYWTAEDKAEIIEDVEDDIASDLAEKVDKEEGKGLSTEDYSTEEKSKLSGIESGAEVNVIETIKVNGTAQSVVNKSVDIPVPTKTSDLNNDSGFGTYTKPSGGIPKTDLAEGVQTSLEKADTAIQEHQDITRKEDKSNKVTNLSDESTDTEYPSAKAVYDEVVALQTKLATQQKIINQLPQASGEGSNITLNNTIEAPFNKFGVKGNCEQEGEPTPDYPQAIQVVTGDNEVQVQNKNLFDISTSVTKKFVRKNDGNIGSSDDWSISDYILVKSNTDYIYSGITNNWSTVAGTCFYDENKNFISSINSNVYSFTTPINAKYLRLSLNSETPTDVQLEEGSATSYESHKEQVYPINLGTIELCKIGDYEDKIFKAEIGDPVYDSLTSEQKASLTSGAWYKYGVIGKVMLDGTENWNYEGGRFLLNFLISALDTSGRQKVYSNYFEYLSSGSADYGIFVYKASSTNSQIYIYDKDYTTVEEFKTWLSTHNTIVYYPLATPTFTQITDTTLISQLDAIEETTSYLGDTNIYTISEDGNTEMIISAKALLDLNSIIT